MKQTLRKSALLAAVASTIGMAAPMAQAAGTITFGEDKSVSVGLGIRSTFTSTEDGATNGSSNSNDFALDSVRLYMNASLNKYIKGTFNTEKKADESIGVIDAIAQFEFMPEFNIWAGRMLPASDRSNLNGPYYLLPFSYPGIVSRYPSRTTGRDDGAAVWGKLLDSRLIYNVGAFEGHNVGTRVGTTPGTSDQPLVAARLQYDFWTPNGAPAFYTGSTTFGAADVLSVGVAAQYQKDGAVSATSTGDYTGWNLDGLMEKKVGPGAVTAEGAYYKYDTDGVIKSEDGTAYLLGLGYIFNEVFGWGRFQPHVRYQKFDRDDNPVLAADKKQYDFGLNYVIDGFNAKLAATYSKVEQTTGKEVDKFIVGVQLQF